MTDLKRLVIYLTEDEKKEIEAISKVMGQTMSTVVGNLVRESMPQLQAVAKAITLAKTNPDAAKKMIRALGYEAQTTLIGEMENLDK